MAAHTVYTEIDNPTLSDVKPGDRVTFTAEGLSGPHPVTAVAESTPGDPQRVTLAGWSLSVHIAITGAEVTIHRIERPVVLPSRDDAYLAPTPGSHFVGFYLRNGKWTNTNGAVVSYAFVTERLATGDVFVAFEGRTAA